MNEEWQFVCPTKLYYEEGGITKIGEIVKDRGHRRIFVIYGGKSFASSGNLQRVRDSLDTYNIEYKELGGVTANPDISFVRSALVLVKEYKPDLILACGGGSVIDAAKSIAHGYYYEGDPLDFNKHIVKPTKALPLGVILTLSASGSEMSSSCVISDRETDFKLGFNSETNYPEFSLLDPSLTYSVSPYQTACGIVDIISHSFERYFCPSHVYELSDYLALSLIKTVIELSPKVISDPTDYEARRAMMMCGLFSHNGWTGIGKKTMMICHKVEHMLSGKHPEIAHGEGLRFLLVEFLKINKERLSDKIKKFGKFVYDIEDVEDTITKLEEFFTSLPLKKRMTECGVSEIEENELLRQLKLS